REHRRRPPGATVSVLPLRPLLLRENVFPAEVVPIVDVKRHGHRLGPKARLLREREEPLVRRRAARAAFAREQLDQRRRTLRPENLTWSGVRRLDGDGEREHHDRRDESKHRRYLPGSGPPRLS